MIRVGIRCDAGPRTGVGHLVRCAALAEELTARGAEVAYLGDLGGERLARKLTTERGIPVFEGPNTPDDLVAAALAHSLHAVVLDSYALPPACAGALRDAGVTVLAMIDGDHRGQRADVYVDQNLGAERHPMALPPGSVRLAGLDYVLLRDDVRLARAARPHSPDSPDSLTGEPPRVLTFFGGTDAANVTPRMADLLVASNVPFTATMITPRPMRVPPLNPGQSVETVEPTGHLPRLAARADLVVTAAGSATWELLYLGVPAALTWVAENQRIAYELTVSQGLAVGFGEAAGLARTASAIVRLRELLTESDLRTRLSAAGRNLIDGRGRERVADVLLEGP